MKKIIVALSSNSCAMRECIVGIFNYANSRKSWDIQLAPINHQAEVPMLLSDASLEGVDGIITGVSNHTKGFDKLVQSGIPLVLNNHPSDWMPADKAPITLLHDDNIAIGKMGAQYLHSKGRFRTYAFARTSVKSFWETYRHRGFGLGLAKWGLTPLTHGIGQSDFADWLRRLPKPIALMAASDGDAINVMETCHRLKLKIPDQVAILGVDNDEFFCKAVRPQLSSIQTNNIEMGRRAAIELERLMRTGNPGKTVYIKPEKIAERDSTRTIPPVGHLIDYGLKFIRENFQYGITVHDVAQHLGISDALLRLRFRSIHGKPVRDILLDLRLEEVKRLLLTSKSSVAQIAKETGFSSACRLTHFFSEKMHMAPLEWQRSQFHLHPSAAADLQHDKRMKHANDTRNLNLQRRR